MTYRFNIGDTVKLPSGAAGTVIGRAEFGLGEQPRYYVQRPEGVALWWVEDQLEKM